MTYRTAQIATLFAAALSLTACGKSEDQIRREERARVEAEFAAKQPSAAVPAAARAAPAPKPLPSSAASVAPPEKPSWAGKYDLKGDGSQGDVAIVPLAGTPARYKVSFGVAGVDGCSGGISGTATEQGSGTLAFTADPSEYAAEEGTGLCTIELKRQANGKSIDAAENYDQCRSWHGANCTFSGTLSRQSKGR